MSNGTMKGIAILSIICNVVLGWFLYSIYQENKRDKQEQLM
ncbi:hypothetical protein [Virgibacillus sp. MSP4-1]|nr:hypothetical protein [Virgibacillus sp. MSP4-1]